VFEEAGEPRQRYGSAARSGELQTERNPIESATDRADRRQILVVQGALCDVHRQAGEEQSA
jgi:hypothetical protein